MKLSAFVLSLFLSLLKLFSTQVTQVVQSWSDLSVPFHHTSPTHSKADKGDEIC